MSCRKYMTEIEEASAGASLSGAARTHLGACAPCREFERERASLRALVGSLGAASAPADFEFRLRARMRAESSRPRRSLFGGAFAPAAGLTLAALFALAVAATLYTRQQTESKATAARVESAGAESQKAEAASAQAARENESAREARPSAGELDNVASAEGRGANEAAVLSVSAPRGSKGLSGERVRAGVEHRTAVFNESRAEVISNPSAGEVALTGPTVAVPLPKSERSLRVLVSDERGTARVVPVRTVSFGSQELVARASNQRAGVNDKEVVW